MTLPVWTAVVIVAIAILITWKQTSAYFYRAFGYWSTEPSREIVLLSERYGPDRFSRDFEEWIIRDALQDKRGGFFLDVGANHYRNENNTYYLEAALGWSGIAVEAQPQFGADYQVHRPKTRFVPMFASDVQGDRVKFFLPVEQNSKLVASASPSMSTREGFTYSETEVPTTTLNALLDEAAVSHVDFVSMDIELAEPKALKGFDIRRFRPSLVCIEAHPEIRQELLDYFHHNGYVVVGKYLRVDSKNLYFRPVS